MKINKQGLRKSIEAWIIEDMPYGDVTTDSVFAGDEIGSGWLVAKEDGILCGIDLMQEIYRTLGSVTIETNYGDGHVLISGQRFAKVTGPISEILKGERIGLNLMQRLSGIASLASEYAKAVQDESTRVVDTRKTTPGLRQLEKYAVTVGGCYNHRYSLSDAVMLKDNHIAAAGSIKKAVEMCLSKIPHTMKIEVEAESLAEVALCIESGAHIIMLDNMTLDMTREAVSMIRSRNPEIIIEASGNMTLERIADVAACGVDCISVGALTHSPKALDISLKFDK